MNEYNSRVCKAGYPYFVNKRFEISDLILIKDNAGIIKLEEFLFVDSKA
jgi:hypothetical protein